MSTGEELLRTHGLRVTRPRLAVLEVLTGGGHLEVDEIARRVRVRLDSVSTQAVYDVLGALSRAGLARRIEPAGSSARFEARVGDNHHHLVCRGCGEITDVDCVVGRRPCLMPSEAHGFELDEAEITFWGLCPACRSRRDAETETARRANHDTENETTWPASHDTKNQTMRRASHDVANVTQRSGPEDGAGLKKPAPSRTVPVGM